MTRINSEDHDHCPSGLPSSPDHRSQSHTGSPPSRTIDGKRLKYVGQACQDCQRRKVKCSGGQICLNCRVRGRDCIYMPQGRRGRKQGTKVMPSRAIERRSDRERNTLQAPSSKRHSDTSASDEVSFLFRKPTFPTAVSSDTSSPEWDNDTDAYEVQEASPRSISLSSQLLCLRDLVHPNGRDQARHPQIRTNVREQTFAVELPRPARLEALLDIYFRDLDSFFPFIEPDGTQTRIHATLQRLGHGDNQTIIDVSSKDHSIIALLCNMFAVAECFCVTGVGSEEIRPGWSLFLRGRKLIQHYSSPTKLDLQLIQYQALSSEYLMQSELLHDALQAISNAGQLAMRARLNDERIWEALPDREILNRKMLWWTIYFLDRKISQRTGSPYVIRDTEVAVSGFSPTSPDRNDRYMQALLELGRLWSLIWDTFFAAAAPRPVDWKEVEIMDTRILMVQRELAGDLVWETDLLDQVYIAQQEPEPHIRRRLAIFIRLNLLRLTIRQNPIQKRDETKYNSICVSLAAQTVDAIAAFTESYPSALPCGFLFSTALLECIYHLIHAIRGTPTGEERTTGIRSFQLAYQLLEQLSQSLDTAKRALRALNSVVSLASISGSLPVAETTEQVPEPDYTGDLNFHVSETIDFFDPTSWQIDDIPLDVIALVSSMGNQEANTTIANGLAEGCLDPGLCLWDIDYGAAQDP